MATFLAGKDSQANVEGDALAMEEWDTTHNGNLIETSNFESNGYQTWLFGLQGLDFNIKGNWDAAQQPMADPPGLYPRDDGTSMQLYLNSGGFFWNMDNGFAIGSAHIVAGVKGAVTFTAAGKAQAQFTTP